MHIDRWLELAEQEKDKTLHHFNFEREIGYSDAHLNLAHDAFSKYLSGVLDDGTPAAHIIADFVSRQASLRGPDDCRYISPAIDSDDRLVFLRTVGSDDKLLDDLGFDTKLLHNIELSISSALRATGAIDAVAEAKMQEDIDQLRRDFRRSLPSGPAPRPAAGRTYRTSTTPDTSTAPWWFTYEAAAINEERSLPRRATPLERSGYVSGMRARLGLAHKDDAKSDQKMATDGKIRFRILFQLAVTLPSGLKDEARQPAIFSDGYPDLFVTRQRRNDGGRTVRLIDRHCASPGHGSCLCVREGLPEGVMKRRVVVDRTCGRELRGIFLAFNRDLVRFVVPSCGDIRNQAS